PVRPDRARSGQDPRALPGLGGLAVQRQTRLVEEPVLLAGVARATGGDHVVPGVRAPLAPGHDVVDVLRGAAAVLAQVAVPGEDGAPVQGHTGLKGDIDVVPEA